MSIKEKIYKGAIYFFITFIVLLLILTLGMPNFIGTSATANRFMAAKVGSEFVTNKEVSQIVESMMQNQYKDLDLPESFRNQIKSQAVEQAIWRKLFYLTSVDAGMFPLASAKNKITADYLRKNFSQYQDESGFNFAKFETEMLKPRGISFADLEMDALWSEGLAKNDAILRSLAFAGTREIVDQLLLQETKFSYEVWQLNSAERDKVLEQEAGITEKQIQDKFTNDHLSKDPKAILSPAKKTLISQELLKEKRGSVEKAWLERLKVEVQEMPLSSVKNRYGGVLARGGLTALTEPVSGGLKAPNGDAVSIGGFDTNLKFIEERARASAGDTLSIIEENGMLYAVKITKTQKPPAELITWREGDTAALKEAFPQYSVQIDDIEKRIESERLEAAYSEMLTIARKGYTIKRFADTN